MERRMKLLWGSLFILFVGCTGVDGQVKPNFIVILADDVGYGDLQCYGHPSQEGGPIDTMAKEGMRFTNWYSAATSCSPSRAALLTGRLPIRTGMFGSNHVAWDHALAPTDSGGLPKNETTIAEALLELGYKTGMVGKWHLGINQNEANDGLHLPVHHGFQQVRTNYPYSQVWECDPTKFTTDEMKNECFKYQEKSIVQQPVRFDTATAELVNDVKAFIQEHSQEPFFFYMSLLQTHCSLFCGEKFCGKSKRGRYGDSMNEMSWAVGEVLDILKQQGIDEKTMVLFLSDNGPHLEMCTDGGQTGFLTGGKPTNWDGGIRVPAIARWPGRIPAGIVNHEVVSTLDIYSTLLELTEQELPGSDTVQDGKSIVGVMMNDEETPHDYLFHYCLDRLMAVRHGNLKFHFYSQGHSLNTSTLCVNGKPKDDVIVYYQCHGEGVKAHDPPLIFNTDTDPEELHPLGSEKYTTELDKVNAAVQTHKSSLTSGEAQFGHYDSTLQPCCNSPNCICNYPNGSPRVEKTAFASILLSAMIYVLVFLRE